MLDAAREVEQRLILDEERAERRLVRARTRLDSAHRRFERAGRRIERRRLRLIEAEDELKSCQSRRAAGPDRSDSAAAEELADQEQNATDRPPPDRHLPPQT